MPSSASAAAPNADPLTGPLPQAELAGPAPVAADEAIDLFAPLLTFRHLLVAVSGGPDSVALMHLLAEWARAPDRPRVSVATVDHGLRAESRAEAEKVVQWAAALGCPACLLSWEGPKPATRLQERARAARYRLLAEHARVTGADCLVLAHHADDAAETVLMRLAAGSGIGGLAGMASSVAREGLTHARPLLGLPKARLLATCAARGLAFIDDPSNADPRFARARWRELAPAHAREGLTSGRLASFARRAARADAALAHAAEAAFARVTCEDRPGRLVLNAGMLAAEPEEIVIRVFGLAFSRGASPVRLERLERLSAGILAAVGAGQPLRATLSGLMLSLDRQGMAVIVREAERRRGRGRSADI